jgi:diguanylate cyclase (GGDEF)-like protein
VNRSLVLVLTLFTATCALALDVNRALTQARLNLWTSESGLPQTTINTIIQSRDGYLWIGTEEGLARFDGIRFVVRDRQNAPALRSPFISCIAEMPDRTLWIGTYGGGIARMRDGHVEDFHPELLGTDRIRQFHATPDGTLFIATAGGGLLRVDGEKVTRFTTRNGLPSDRIWAIEDDGEGGLWVATHGGGVVRWRDGRVQQRITTGLPNDVARAVLRDADGRLWIGTDGAGVVVWQNGAILRTITTRDGLPNDYVRTLLRDSSGSLWIGTDNGLARWRGVRAEPMSITEGLPNGGIRSLLEDRERNLWVGTAGGLVRMRDTRVLSYTRREGLPVDTIRAILEDRSGRVWVGTEGGGLCNVVPGPLRCISKADGLHDSIYALLESRDGSMWIGTDGAGVVRFRDGKLVERVPGLPNDRVRALVETADGSLWISKSAGLSLVRGGVATPIHAFDDRQLRPLLELRDGSMLVGTDGAGLWRVDADGTHARILASVDGLQASEPLGLLGGPEARRPGGLESDRVFSLAMESDGSGVWIGTSGGGLSRLDLTTNRLRSLMRRDGLHDDVVFQVVDTGDDLWMTSNRGLYRVARDQVRAAMNGKKSDLSGTVYGTTDGMPSAECVGAWPSVMRARNGNLWVATARGVAVVDPKDHTRNTVPPPVYVEEVLIDGNTAPPGPLRVRQGTQRVELRYTALSLRAPERVTFRYLLEGYDTSWVDAGTARVAHYTKLAPGDYTFRVIATNEDGVRSRGEARLAMTVDPRWFETWWARLLEIALIAAAIWGALRIRIAAMRARKNEELARLATELEDANRQLAVANERLRALSYVDGLTGVANRRRFDEALEEACSTASKQNAPLSLVLIDLDHFKRLNDSQGHQIGDEALRAMATLLATRAESRGGLVARFGGEEFAWLLPGVTLDAAKAEAESFRLVVRDARIRHDGTASGVMTASLGVTAATGPIAPLSLVAAADAALYRAKSSGRDRVEAEPMA